MSRTSSAAMLTQATMKLPPILKEKHPWSFDDMYSSARFRVAKQSAVMRKGGLAKHLLGGTRGQLPAFPGGVVKLSAYYEPRDEEDQATQVWASSALAAVPARDPEDAVPVSQREETPKKARIDQQVKVEEKSGDDDDAKEGAKNADEKHAPNKRVSMISVNVPVELLAPSLVALLETVAARNEGTSEGFTDEELHRYKTAFGRFKIPGESDMYVTDVEELLRYLGHVMTKSEKVLPVVRQVTSYDYMDYEEFLTFMDKFILFEKEEYRNTFNEFDEDGSGEISVKELRQLCKSLGFVPLRAMVDEALSVVDCDGNGQLNFDELVTFLAVYSHAEGFTRKEVDDVRRQFDHFSVDGGSHYGYGIRVLPPDRLANCLVQAFGLQVSPTALDMEKQLVSGQGLQKSSFDKGGGDPECVYFEEFLIFARRIRDLEYKRCLKENPNFAAETAQADSFENADTDGSGGISEIELTNIMVSKGYTPLRTVIEEILDEVYDGDWDPETSQLDFDEFFDFMLVLEQRDGFTQFEVSNLRNTYDRFDEDGSGEVSAMECADLFRYVGYRVSLEDLREEVQQVDVNGSGQLDFREFLRLMRLYREKELRVLSNTFDEYKDETDRIPANLVERLLAKLGHEPPYPNMERELLQNGFSIDDLVSSVDQCRNAFVAKERKKAGFSDDEIENMRVIYNRFDTNHNDVIDNIELMGILKEFQWEPRTREQQTVLVLKLEEARALAKESGIEDVGDSATNTLTFWSFIQLARMLRTERDREEEVRLSALQKELRFSEGEVEDFRQIFRAWFRRSVALDEEAGRPRKSTREVLSRDMIRRLVRSLGISISPAHAAVLDQQLMKLDESARLEHAELDFFAFLKLMRWILDKDFAGINDAAAKLAP